MDIDVIDKRKSPASWSMRFRWVPSIEEYFSHRRIDWLYWIVDIKPKWLFDLGVPVALIIFGMVAVI